MRDCVTSGMDPLVVKEFQSLEDAKIASEPGVDVITLINHGGRQEECGLPPITLSGAAVVTALCLGAQGVFFGRAYLYRLMAAGEVGVEKTIDIFTNEIATTMALIGATSIDELGPQFLR